MLHIHEHILTWTCDVKCCTSTYPFLVWGFPSPRRSTTPLISRFWQMVGQLQVIVGTGGPTVVHEVGETWSSGLSVCNRGCVWPFILEFTSKIQVDAHLDDKTHVFTGVMYILHLQTLLTYALTRWKSPTVWSDAQMHGRDGRKPKAKFVWTIFTSLLDKNLRTHFSYCLHPLPL